MLLRVCDYCLKGVRVNHLVQRHEYKRKELEKLMDLGQSYPLANQ